MSRTDSSVPRPFALGTLTLAFAGLLIAVPSLALAIAPAIMLLLLLLADRRPGEALIERWARRRRPASRRQETRTIEWPSIPFVASRAGRLIAFALWMRPPPAQTA